MLLLTSMLLLIVASLFGFSRRPWWQIGALALLATGPLLLTYFWMDDWRYRVGVSQGEQLLDAQQIVWVAGWLIFSSYAGYALGLMYSHWGRAR
jgi:hypothetical protein